MNRAVQQQKRSLSSSLSTSSSNRKLRCSFICTLTLLFLVLLVILFLGIYNVMFVEEQIQATGTGMDFLLKTAARQVLRKNQQIISSSSPSDQNQDQQHRRGNQGTQATKSSLVLTTPHGTIRIALRPDLSQESVDYIYRLVQSNLCQRCNFYRAEKPGILQGVMANKNVQLNTVKGSCPRDMQDIPNDCPPWDDQCGCHGPLMTKGSVAWAAGQAGGPDFFIDNYERPAKWWGTQHTNFGHILDEESFRVINIMFDLPIKKSDGMTYLKDIIHFDLSLE